MKHLLLFCLSIIVLNLPAQITIDVTVEGATTSTTCANPDVLFEVNVEGQGNVTYPQQGFCYTALPNVQYSEVFTCQSDVPDQLEVCFDVFDNDHLLSGLCFIDRSCSESICDFFDVPPAGMSTSYTLALTGGASEGELSFTITNNGIPDNDLPCDAIDLGLLTRGDTIGDNSNGIYHNLCGTNQNEPDPETENGFGNENGVWFQFTTDSDIGSLFFIETLSDPNNVGDHFDIQIAVYGSDNDACDGNMTLLSWTDPFFQDDARLHFRCPSPNTTYFILIDGGFSAPGSEEGYFGIQVVNIDVDEGGDLRCDATDLGPVPENGSVGLDEMLANFCATGIGDPFSPNFVTQTSVWFEFQAPPSGHVLIEAVSDREVDSIGIQVGLYRPINGLCTGFFQHIASQYTFEDLDESMEVSCLFPGDSYFILIDGDGGNGRGIFDLTISDAGDITPVTNQSDTICAGDTYNIGGSSYTASGIYSDTFSLFMGCDSIVVTDLTVLEPISININQTEPAIGDGGPMGMANAAATGGTGNYSYAWCDGITGDSHTNLTGGSLCCVTVTDDFGCMNDTCFTVEFVTGIIPSFTADTLDCNGDEDGIISFSVMSGVAPYSYSWQNEDDSINGTGGISAENEEVTLPDLPAGIYTIMVQDEFFDTTFVVEILEPEALILTETNLQNASCFGFCDGALSVEASGGTGSYTYEWSNTEMGNAISDLCAQLYTATVTDENNCQESLELEVTEPEEFIVTAVEVSPVSCFGDSDGVIMAETNGSPIAYNWDTGDMTSTVSGLPTGNYSVDVTNSDGCMGSATGFISEPSEAVSLSIIEIQAVSCTDASDAILEAIPAGPGSNFNIQWSNNVNGALLDNVGAGTYTATATNENNCVATAEYQLSEPSIIQATTSATDLTCLSGENGGIINIDTTFGGTPPYQYSLDGTTFSPGTVLAGLTAGTYDITIMDDAGCEGNFSQNILAAPEFTVELGTDETIHLGDSILLTANSGSNNAIYSWSTPDSLSKDISGPSIFVTPHISTAYYVEAFDTITLCTSSDVIFINVIKDRRVYVPNAFSPNEDGRNDFFFINTDNAAVMIHSLRIFSRGGNMVYEAKNIQSNNPENGWDGTFRGEELDPGVFVYVAEIEFTDGAVEVFQGDVILVK
ncbi:MAG: gliding motility-associated C-terminal domain-containing protein [Chitinophagales bacterium]|nr:gliding motility-associated C-terminal domain-containing protein [Chitinophagales bacterium]